MSLSLSGISHQFGDIVAVSDVGLDVAPGEIFCLFGPSGCGKTTLLRLIAGLEAWQSGGVKLDGEILAGAGIATPPEKRPIGFVFQDFALFPHLNVRDNIAFGIDKKTPEAHARVAAQLADMELSEMGERFAHQLSGGQQQRVALARALIRNPKALLLDEPFASIDTVLRRQLRENLRSLLKAQKIPAILVTHDPEEALAIGDRIGLMREGRLVEVATPKDLYERPTTIDGANLFPGGQKLVGTITDENLSTPFGAFPAPGCADGSGIAILRTGACSITQGAGPNSICDMRFSGPDWDVGVVAEDGTILRANADTQPEIGAMVDIAFDQSGIFVFELNGLESVA